MAKKTIPTVAFIGQTNVGKSSLFNLFVKHKRNIVAKEAGTTRDSIYELTEITDNQYLWLIDTAGLKKAEDDFELTIQDQINLAINNADLICVLIEAHKPLDYKDRNLAKMALKTKKKVILVVNKVDLNHRARSSDFAKLGIKDIFLISTTTRAGIVDLINYLSLNLPKIKPSKEDSIMRISLLGRPNVGKSALFNSLAKKQQALVSEQAGTTRDINRLKIRFNQQAIEFLDTAGMRRSGKIEVGIEKFSIMRTMLAIADSDICLLLIDVNELATAVEQKIAGIVKESGKGLIIVVTKWDSLEAKDEFSINEIKARIKNQFEFVPWASFIITSAITGRNVAKILEIALSIHRRRQQTISTSKLNKYLQQTINLHPPAGLKNRHPRLNYITQIDTSPPTFQFFGSHMTYLHWSYKRFLERKFREEFDYEGTALVFNFKEKH